MMAATEQKKRILFVDDEQQVLNGLRRSLFDLADEWQMDFTTDGAAALEIMTASPFDVVVSDMSMSGCNGADLLDNVAQRHPAVIRIVLSGSTEKESGLRAAGSAHQFLAKPLDPRKLQDILKRTLGMREALVDDTMKALVTDLRSLPSPPSLYHELMHKMQSPVATLADAGALIAQDVSMTAKMLQMVNSSFFGLPVHVSDPTHAAKLLGLDILKGLVLSANLFSQYDEIELPGFSLAEFSEHSLSVAALAKAITQTQKAGKLVADNAFLGGMLHDVGKLILAQNFPDRYAAALLQMSDDTTAVWQKERQAFGTSHAELGAYLLCLWGLPEQLVASVAFHHTPGKSMDNEFSALTAVCSANELSHQMADTPTRPGKLHQEYLAKLQLTDRLPEWQALAQIKQQERTKL